MGWTFRPTPPHRQILKRRAGETRTCTNKPACTNKLSPHAATSLAEKITHFLIALPTSALAVAVRLAPDRARTQQHFTRPPHEITSRRLGVLLHGSSADYRGEDNPHYQNYFSCHILKRHRPPPDRQNCTYVAEDCVLSITAFSFFFFLLLFECFSFLFSFFPPFAVSSPKARTSYLFAPFSLPGPGHFLYPRRTETARESWEWESEI